MFRLHLCGGVGFCLALMVSTGPAGAAVHTTALVEAVTKADHPAIRAKLRAGANANEVLADGSTALHWAVERGDQVAVDVLLQAGANARTTSRYGVTPLLLAALDGHAGIITRLLKAGGDPNSALREGETALMTAARTTSKGTPEPWTCLDMIWWASTLLARSSASRASTGTTEAGDGNARTPPLTSSGGA